LRLIAAGGGLLQGVYHAGAEIRLEPGALTYWRTPGSAGVPPEFSFAGSTNAAEVAVSYPVPQRIDEDGSEVFGYRGGVTFPLQVTPADASRPVLLVLTLSYAVCARICLPAKGEAQLTLTPSGEAQSGGADLEASILAAAEASVPSRLTQQQGAAKATLAPVAKAAPPAWRISLSGGEVKDLLAEAPAGWYFETRKTGLPNEFLLVEVERPKDADPEQPAVTLTVKDEPQSYEFPVSLGTASGLTEDAHEAPAGRSQAAQK
jgi:hypothetical protein